MRQNPSLGTSHKFPLLSYVRSNSCKWWPAAGVHSESPKPVQEDASWRCRKSCSRRGFHWAFRWLFCCNLGSWSTHGLIWLMSRYFLWFRDIFRSISKIRSNFHASCESHPNDQDNQFLQVLSALNSPLSHFYTPLVPSNFWKAIWVASTYALYHLHA